MNQQARRAEPTATASPTGQLFTAQQTALGELMAGMDADARWVLLVGPHHSGKSTVIRALLEELRVAAATVAVFDGQKTADVDQLVGGVRDQLGLPRRRKLLGDDHSVSDIVTSQSGQRTPLVVMVDDADALSAASIKWLARLAGRSSRTDTACYVVLAGTPALEKTANRAWAMNGSGRASLCSMLRPMTRAEVDRYVDQWTRSVGNAAVKFSDAAIQKIEMYSKGRPGLIGELCARAAALPSTRLTDEVSADAVVETAERLGLSPATGSSAQPERQSEVESRPRRTIAGRAARLIGTATLAVLLIYLGTRVALTLLATSTDWLDVSVPAVHRSASDVVRAPGEETRREPAVTIGRGRGATASAMPSTRQGREQRSAETTQRAGALDPSAQQIAALIARAREGEVGELTRLVSSGVSPNVRDVGGFTALMAAVVNDQIPAARILLDHGADINARAHGGITALMLAVINDRPQAVTLLLERGAEVNAQSGAGWTALTFAVWKGDADVVRTLRNRGAKPNVIDKQGWTPFEYSAPKFTPTDTASRGDGEHGVPQAVPSNKAETR